MRKALQIAVAGGFAITASFAFAYSSEQFAKQAKISMAQAAEIALRIQPDKVTDSE
ncbi:MAG: hypothetical protein JSR55_05100 [Proteobacteria bacterium]|nr:hypothetical protein [Pseudomonadota bacterium]